MKPDNGSGYLACPEISSRVALGVSRTSNNRHESSSRYNSRPVQVRSISTLKLGMQQMCIKRIEVKEVAMNHYYF